MIIEGAWTCHCFHAHVAAAVGATEHHVSVEGWYEDMAVKSNGVGNSVATRL